MKKWLLVLFLIGNAAGVFSQQTLFINKNYNEAVTASKAQKKPIVLFFYANWCPHCNTMKRSVFTDTAVSDFYNQNFICIGVDSESESGKNLKAKFQDKFKVLSYPTFAFLDGDENLLYCTSGELNKEKFLAEGNEVLLPENQLPNLRQAFVNDPTNADKCLKYIINVRKAGLDATAITQKYLRTVMPENKFTEQNWRIFSNGINDFDTDEFRFIVDNKAAFSKVASVERVDKKIVYTISETFKPLIDKVDTISYDKKRIAAEAFHNRKIDSLLYRFDIQIVSQTVNWKKYEKVTLNNVEKFSWNDPVVLYDICNTYYETVPDQNGLLRATEWSKHLLSLGASIDRYILTAKLSMKIKNYKQALDFAGKGKALAQNLGLNSAEVDALLEDIKKHNL